MLETLEKKYILVFGNCDKELKIEHSTENKKKTYHRISMFTREKCIKNCMYEKKSNICILFSTKHIRVVENVKCHYY